MMTSRQDPTAIRIRVLLSLRLLLISFVASCGGGRELTVTRADASTAGQKAREGAEAGANKSNEASGGVCKEEPEVLLLCDVEAPQGGLALAASGDSRIDALAAGSSIVASNGVVTYSFYEDDIFRGSYPRYTNVKEVSEKVKENYREIFRNLSLILPLSFKEVEESTTNAGTIRIMRADLEPVPGGQVAGYGNYPGSTLPFSTASDVILNSSFQHASSGDGFENGPGSRGYAILVHELGHALGLKHPFDGASTLAAADNNNANTVMSYSRLGEGAPVTFMAFDVLALRHLYGPPASSADPQSLSFLSTYQWQNDQSLREVLPAKRLLAFDQAVSAVNLQALAPETSGYRIDLRPGGVISAAKDFFSGPANYFSKGSVLAMHTAVADVVTSSSDDTIYANGLANRIAGFHPARASGHDVIYGADSADTLDLSAFAEKDVELVTGADHLLLKLRADSSVKLMNFNAATPVKIAFLKEGSGKAIEVAAPEVSKLEEGRYLVKLPLLLSSPVSQVAAIDYTASTVVGGKLNFTPESGKLTLAGEALRHDLVVEVGVDFAGRPEVIMQLNLLAPAGLSLSRQSVAIVLSKSDSAPVACRP